MSLCNGRHHASSAQTVLANVTDASRHKSCDDIVCMCVNRSYILQKTTHVSKRGYLSLSTVYYAAAVDIRGYLVCWKHMAEFSCDNTVSLFSTGNRACQKRFLILIVDKVVTGTFAGQRELLLP
jgi:hypothetical protein